APPSAPTNFNLDNSLFGANH
ncbi:hypothetical protein A2U01_0077565, partial [Trifolium medium]|nr:hypothetical protein [Trifolium medium]